MVEGLQTDTVVIDMSTISPTATREMADTIRQNGAHMLDATVSGGEGGALLERYPLCWEGLKRYSTAACLYLRLWVRISSI